MSKSFSLNSNPTLQFIQEKNDAAISKFFLGFTIPDILNNSVIVMASLNLKVEIDSLVPKPVEVTVYPLAESWNASDAAIVKDTIFYIDTLCSYIRSKLDSRNLCFNVTEIVGLWNAGYTNN